MSDVIDDISEEPMDYICVLINLWSLVPNIRDYIHL